MPARSADSRCMRALRPRRTRAKSSNACAGTLHARQSARSDCRSRRRAHRYQLKTPWRNGTTHVGFGPVDLMAHIPVRHPAGDLRSSKSAILPIRHRQSRGLGTATARPPDPLPRCLCAERDVARATDAIEARQTSSYRRGVDWGQQRPPQPRRKAPLDDLGAAPQARLTPGILPSALRASLSAVPNRSRRFGQH